MITSYIYNYGLGDILTVLNSLCINQPYQIILKWLLESVSGNIGFWKFHDRPIQNQNFSYPRIETLDFCGVSRDPLQISEGIGLPEIFWQKGSWL